MAKKKIFEIFWIILGVILILSLSHFESKLFPWGEALGEDLELLRTLAYFALINLNIILILFLGFLIFRHITKLVIERRHGILGARLKTKLVASLVCFAVAPTIFLFYVSSHFITTSFDTWFSIRVQNAMEEMREAGSMIYKQDQKRLAGLARMAIERIILVGGSEGANPPNKMFKHTELICWGLRGFVNEYGLHDLKVFQTDERLLWHQSGDLKRGDGGILVTSLARIDPFPDGAIESDDFVEDAIKSFQMDPGLLSKTAVIALDSQDVVKAAAPLRDATSGDLIGIVVGSVRFEAQILQAIENIIADFSNLKPNAQLIRSSYIILMALMALLIIFAAIWMGFYVARRITEPLKELSQAIAQVASGNYQIHLDFNQDDETGQLVRAFNRMARDLSRYRKHMEEAQAGLEKSLEELDQRRRYMEVILRNITTGVLSVDSLGRITSFNSAAENLLQRTSQEIIGKSVLEGLGLYLHKEFWTALLEKLEINPFYYGQLEITLEGRLVVLVASATKIKDESGLNLGTLMVFDDASEQLKAQKVLAWREVARRIAHEIKNPITPIKLSAERLLRRYGDKFSGDDREIFTTCLQTISHQVDSLRDLVNEFAKFSRLPNIKPQLGSINAVLKETVNLFCVSYPQVKFDLSEFTELPPIFIDKEQMNRVFVNILTNAVAALAPERPGVVGVKSLVLWDMATIRLEIFDNGTGIPVEFKDRVFEPYFSTKSEGSGLGLAIVHQIVGEHGGYLRLADNKPNGTVVIIELPFQG